MAPRRSAFLCGLRYSAIALLTLWGAPEARAQDSSTCTEVTVAGLIDDSFPAEGSLYTNNLAGDDTVRGTYINEDDDFFIWYSPTDPTEWTADISDADIADCNGVWVLSSYPPGDTFEDTVWYEASGVQCETSPVALPSAWVRVDLDLDSEEDVSVEVSCSSSIEEDSSSDGLSNKTVIVLIIVVGIGFMVLMCLGALACCIHKGKQSAEENIMPPGELPDEGSVIGGRVGDATKPGLHAHPEVRGAQHPHPEDWAPSYASHGNGHIPTGSRSGPSVRSIGYA
ncbi:unnamed protein product [Pylaiella littoralis]